jgi:HEAT repeat protein
MGHDATPKRLRLRSLWWVACLLAVVFLLVVPFFRTIEFDVGPRSYSLLTEAVTPNGPFSDQGPFIHTGWDGPTGEFTHGDIFGIKLGKHLLRFDIVEDPIAAAQRRLPKTLDGLVNTLNSKDDWLRRVAMQRIEELGGAALVAIPALVKRVEQGDQEAEDALATVCKAAGDRAVSALTNALTSRLPKLRGKAAEILGEIGPPARASVPLLRERLHDADPQVVALSAMSLRKIDGRGEGGVPVLMTMLTNKLPDIRGLAAVALAEFGADAGVALPDLIRYLDDSDHQVVTMAARSIGLIGASARAASGVDLAGTNAVAAIPKLTALTQGEEPLADWAMEALSVMGPDAAPVLTGIYGTADGRRRQVAARALMKLGPDAGEAVPILMADLRGTNAGRVVLAAEVLGCLGDRGRVALPQLEGLLQHQNIRVRVRAAGAIWKLDGRTNAVLPVLLEALQDESIHRGSARRYAAEALGGMGVAARDAVPLLQAMLNDRQSGLPQAAAEALEKISKSSTATPRSRLIHLEERETDWELGL